MVVTFETSPTHRRHGRVLLIGGRAPHSHGAPATWPTCRMPNANVVFVPHLGHDVFVYVRLPSRRSQQLAPAPAGCSDYAGYQGTIPSLALAGVVAAIVLSPRSGVYPDANGGRSQRLRTLSSAIGRRSAKK